MRNQWLETSRLLVLSWNVQLMGANDWSDFLNHVGSVTEWHILLIQEAGRDEVNSIQWINGHLLIRAKRAPPSI